jgi:membrane protease YdiL (CAAX protease family)
VGAAGARLTGRAASLGEQADTQERGALGTIAGFVITPRLMPIALPIAVLLPFLLLGAAVLAVWWPRPAADRVAPWMPAFAAAVVAALVAHVLAPVALAWLSLLAALCIAARRAPSAPGRIAATAAAALLALAMSLHLLPGFHNPMLLAQVQVSRDAPPFTQYLSFDKGAAGLLLLAAFAPRAAGARVVGRALAIGTVGGLATAAVVLGLACAAGVVHADLKLPAYTAAFLGANLVLTCVAEEAFFRGLLQHRLQAVMHGRAARWLPIVASAVLFGLAHAGGGAWMPLLAGIAGLGYGLAFARAGTIEAPIVAHFGLNAIHFLCFSYPALR